MQPTDQNLCLESRNPNSYSFAGESQHENRSNLGRLSPLQTFQKEIFQHLQHNPYNLSEQFIRWERFLKENRNSAQTEQYIEYIEKFLEYFPFNRRYWQQWIFLHRSLSKENSPNELSCYQKALQKNPKCYQLWESYIQLLNKKLVENQQSSGSHPISNSPISPLNSTCTITPQIFRKQLEKAILEIGTDSRSSDFYKAYYPLLGDSSRYQFYKKIFTRCLDTLEEFYAQFEKWLEIQCTQDIAKNLFNRENKGRFSSSADGANGTTFELDRIKEYLKSEIDKIYQTTVHYREARRQYINQVTIPYFEDRFQPSQTAPNLLQQLPLQKIEQNLLAFQELINFQREKGGTVENISYHYERSIMAHPQNLQLWQDTFHYLENQTGKYPKVLSILRNNETFFIRCPSRDLYFYWSDLEERENPQKARLMYQKLQSYYLPPSAQLPIPLPQTFEILQRRVQFQIRCKQLPIAKEIFDQMLALYSMNSLLLSHTLIQYVKFVTRFYKDFEYPKKLLKMYFEYEHLPFSQYLFIEYLEFMRNFEHNEGYYDEMMAVVLNGVQKAKKQLKNGVKFNEVVRMVKQYLRGVLGSIYLIKISERKVMEVVEAEVEEKNELLLL